MTTTNLVTKNVMTADAHDDGKTNWFKTLPVPYQRMSVKFWTANQSLMPSTSEFVAKLLYWINTEALTTQELEGVFAYLDDPSVAQKHTSTNAFYADLDHAIALVRGCRQRRQATVKRTVDTQPADPEAVRKAIAEMRNRY